MRFRKSLAAGAVLALANCGGGETAAPIVNVNPSFAQASSDTLSTAFTGQEILAKSVVTRQDLVSGGTTTTNVQTVYGYNPATQILTLRIGGNTRSFDLTGSDPNTQISARMVEQDPGRASYGILVRSDDLQNYLGGTATYDYLIPIRSYYYEDGSRAVLRSYGVVGLQTPDSAVSARTDTANYSGQFQIENYTSGSANFLDRVTYFGSMNANVDFAAGQLTSGAFNVLSKQNGIDPASPETGTLTLGTAALSGNGFSTDLSSGVSGLTLQTGSKVEGVFFGPNAEELGGTVAYKGNLNGTQIDGFGFFSGQ